MWLRWRTRSHTTAGGAPRVKSLVPSPLISSFCSVATLQRGTVDLGAAGRESSRERARRWIPLTLCHTMAATGSLLPVWVAYFATKTAVRFLHPKGVATSWDDVSLFHNLLSVVVGAYAIWKYGADTASACEAFSDPAAIVIAMQAIHSITDFVVYAKEMLEQPIFIAHHGILVVICFVLPTCPGCAYTTWAMTVGEAGSASIAIDALWRRYGFPSRGLKRVVFFGWSRAFSLYFLYEIMLVTPSQTEFTLSSEGKELLTFNFPVCMMTGVGALPRPSSPARLFLWVPASSGFSLTISVSLAHIRCGRWHPLDVRGERHDLVQNVLRVPAPLERGPCCVSYRPVRLATRSVSRGYAPLRHARPGLSDPEHGQPPSRARPRPAVRGGLACELWMACVRRGLLVPCGALDDGGVIWLPERQRRNGSCDWRWRRRRCGCRGGGGGHSRRRLAIAEQETS